MLNSSIQPEYRCISAETLARTTADGLQTHISNNTDAITAEV
jgi:hypothetical protein